MVLPRVGCISGERVGTWRFLTIIALHVYESYVTFLWSDHSSVVAVSCGLGKCRHIFACWEAPESSSPERS
jgi:hypothetical protein